MGLDEWELLDCDEVDERKLVDQKIASNFRDTDRCIGRDGCDEQEIGVEDDKDADSQLSGDLKKDMPRFLIAAESDAQEEGVSSGRMNTAMEKRGLAVQKWGRAAMCSFGIAVAATICSVLLGMGSHGHHGGGSNKQNQKNRIICPCE